MPYEPLPDTWSWRDLPVLRAAVAGVDQTPIIGIELGAIVRQTGLNLDDVYRSSKALESAGLVALNETAGGASSNRVNEVAGAARVLAGQWPDEESTLDRIVAALEAIAQNTNDEDTRTNARKFAGWLRTSANTVGLAVATAAITGQIPGAGS